MKPPIELLTLGHGAATSEELASLIVAAGIEAIVDVRKMPGSRRHPQFGRAALEEWVPALSRAAYRWEPWLGGFRKPSPASENIALRNPSFRAYADYMESAEFSEVLRQLLEQAAQARTAVMCSESLWWRCHRRLIADAATLIGGAAVNHLGHDGKLHRHILTEGVRQLADGKLRYDDLPLLGSAMPAQ